MKVEKFKPVRQPAKKKFMRKGLFVAAGLFVLIGGISLSILFGENPASSTVKTSPETEERTVEVPAIELPEGDSYGLSIRLIVYNDKIYTEAATTISAENGQLLLGEKLGTTKDSLDEWSDQSAYREEFASTIGIADVYSVKGYDEDFRLMTYEKSDGVYQARFYDNLNGITVTKGEDAYSKFNLSGNVVAAEFQLYSEWDSGKDIFHSIADLNAVNAFISNMNETIPFLQSSNHAPPTMNDESFRKLFIHLKDGSVVEFSLSKNGYIYYGSQNLYFKMNEEDFSGFWNHLEISH